MEIVIKLIMALIVSFILYTYLGYPVILFILGIFRRPSSVSDSFELPSVAMIISAHNEERIIREKLENSLQIDYPRELLRIIVASDGSIDNTDSIVREFEDRNVALYDRLLGAGGFPDDVIHVFEHNRMASLERHKPAFERCSSGGEALAAVPGRRGCECGGHRWGRTSDSRGERGCGRGRGRGHGQRRRCRCGGDPEQ